ncbi:hypothetical protein DFJ73DRAFT_786533 [Zopfochytrium polystomum]|nr:hypothetical protein DFJ73DRAFT_786533 [Zopfochytrium polystomum]
MSDNHLILSTGTTTATTATIVPQHHQQQQQYQQHWQRWRRYRHSPPASFASRAQAPAVLNDGQVIHPSLSLSASSASNSSSSALEPLSIEDAVDRDLAEPLAGKEGGVLQDRLVAEGLAPASTLVWIGSVQASVESVIALPGARLVADAASRSSAASSPPSVPSLASFCTHSVAGLIMTEGFMFGLGQSLCFYASAMLPATYFLRRRNLATGIVFSGAGVGGAVFSIITAQLLETTDLAWTLRIVGCIFLAMNLPAALVLKSRSQPEPFSLIPCDDNIVVLRMYWFKILTIDNHHAGSFSQSRTDGSGMFSLFPGTIANVFGSRNLSQFFNLIFFFWMPGYFLGSPIAGYLLHAYGGPEGGIGAYRPAIFYSGVLSLIAAGFVLAVRVIQDRSMFKKM